ncbi:hypothetical protein AB0K12_47760 [Nonomuraea sp. NPDC049419]|uniref:hypothetical protein n=1 Tax=Nonomuraea sp. NPDC049419 TaxID=3155772 RepID=UPI003438EBBD
MSAVTDWVKHDHAEVIAETPELARAHVVQELGAFLSRGRTIPLSPSAGLVSALVCAMTKVSVSY